MLYLYTFLSLSLFLSTYTVSLLGKGLLIVFDFSVCVALSGQFLRRHLLRDDIESIVLVSVNMSLNFHLNLADPHPEILRLVSLYPILFIINIIIYY